MNESPDWILPHNGGYMLYFGVPDGNIANLPADAIFDVIDCVAWNKVRWQAIDRIEKHGKHKGEWGRAYRVVMERDLDADEAAVWTEYLVNWETEQQTVTTNE